MKDYHNQKIAIVGLGIEGLALYDFLRDKAGSLYILDREREKKLIERADNATKKKTIAALNDNKVNKILGENYLDNLGQFSVIFRSPGISYFHPKIQLAINRGVRVSSQIKLFFQICPCPIIGVTGTKGKGTTASLLFDILKKSSELNSKRKIYLAGNIGSAAITLLPLLKKDDFIILELSSFQLMDLQQSPHIAIVTNLLPEHQDYHRDLDEYHKAKVNIIAHQNSGGLAILNINSTFSSAIQSSIKSRLLYFSGQRLANRENSVAAWIEGGVNPRVVIQHRGVRGVVCRQNEIKLFGFHNLENIAAAALASLELGVKIDTISRVVKEFEGLPHRLEFVREVDGVKFVNDSFGTTPDTAIAAVKAFNQNKIFILGGSSKRADFSQLARAIATSNVSGVVLIGDEAYRIKDALGKENYTGRVVAGEKDISKIVYQAKKLAGQGDVVVLSPACASFGLFKNYKDRGEKFKKAVFDLSE